MVIKNNKDKGNAGMSLAIAYFGCNGFIVSIPLNDTQDYDLIIDSDLGLKKVQVKFTDFKNKAGNYVANLRSAGGTKGAVYSRVIDLKVDFLFVVCSDKTMYMIPLEDLTCTNSIVLNKLNQKRNKNQNTKDYSTFIVEI